MGVLAQLKKLFAAKPKSPFPIIDVKKRFEIQNKVGQGSMSKVFRARDYKLGGRTVCLKILDKIQTAKFEARFVGMQRPSEGAICMALRHDNVVRTYEFGLTPQNEQVIVMELIEGEGLNFFIETRNKLLDGNRINFLVQAADGLDYVHKQGYLHRDICPRNMMVTKDKVVKLIDFGLAIPYKREFCKPGNRTGTIDYLAPELIKRATTDHRVDLFALGVTAYVLITGIFPWEKAGGSMQVLQSHMNSPGRDPRERKPDLDDRMAKILIKAIERHPANRFQSAAEFREALKALPKQDY